MLETYGSGNAPRKEWFIRRLCQASERGIVIVNVTQCSAGMVEMERYETGYISFNWDSGNSKCWISYFNDGI